MCILLATFLSCSVFVAFPSCASIEHSQRLFPRYGTTSFLATVVLPRGHARTHATLDTLNASCGKTGRGAVLEGIHAEVCEHGSLFVVTHAYILGEPAVPL